MCKFAARMLGDRGGSRAGSSPLRTDGTYLSGGVFFEFRLTTFSSATLSGPRMRIALKMVFSARPTVKVGDSLSIFLSHDVSPRATGVEPATRDFVERQPSLRRPQHRATA